METHSKETSSLPAQVTLLCQKTKATENNFLFSLINHFTFTEFAVPKLATRILMEKQSSISWDYENVMDMSSTTEYFTVFQ